MYSKINQCRSTQFQSKTNFYDSITKQTLILVLIMFDYFVAVLNLLNIKYQINRIKA
jgi:hypothetical protein